MDLSAEIVAAFVANNSLPVSELPGLIAQVHAALVSLLTGTSAPVAIPRWPASEPAVPIKKSVTDGYIFCLEDGHKFKSLKRHLRTSHGLTPAAYREKWHLPHDYPMVAPAYAKARSTLAKNIGLGLKRRIHKNKGG
jgi:predicted transcriptional regulator